MQIYVAEGTQQTGPFDLEAIREGLRAGRYQPGQLGWYEGAPGWEPLSKIPGLEAAAPPPPAPAPPPPPPAPTGYAPAPPAPGAYSPAPAPTGYAPAPYPSAPPPSTGQYNPGAPMNSPYGAGPVAPPTKGLLAKIGAGLVALLVFLGGIAKIAFLPSRSHYSSSPYHSTPTPASRSTPASTPASTGAPASTQLLTYNNNANQFTSGERQKYYVNFRVNYPNTWEIASGTKTSSQEYFLELNRIYQGSYVESFTVEDFYTSDPSLAQALPILGAKYMASIDANRRKTKTNYQKISEGPTRINNYAAYEYRSRYVVKNDKGESYDVFLRYDIVAPNAGQNGVILEMIVNSYSPDVKNIDDVGTKGEFGGVVRSFAFQ